MSPSVQSIHGENGSGIDIQGNRVLVFGGPYGNLAATQAIRKYAREQGIPAGNVICTGDIAAYCAEPERCVEIIREWGIHVVQGNCEESLGNDLDDCACGFEEGSACSVLSEQWFAFNRSALSQASKAWMRELPDQLRFTFAGIPIVCIHGSYGQNNAFIFQSTSQDVKASQFQQSGAKVMIGGHSGIPFGQQLKQGVWLNAGVIGMPANDGTDSTWFMEMNRKDEGVVASWHRLHYDVDATMAAMRANGLDNAYRQSLESGLWPSMDVLPEQERRRVGKAISIKATRLLVD